MNTSKDMREAFKRGNRNLQLIALFSEVMDALFPRKEKPDVKR